MSKKEFFLLLIVTIIAAVIWIAAEIFHTRSQVSISPQLQEALQPVDPSLDISVLQKIATPPPAPVSTPTPKPTTIASPLESSSSSALLPQPTVEPSSSSSADLSTLSP